jgi:heme exporter protein A
MLEVSKLECVRGERRLFRDLGFMLEPGTLLEVRGANGSGKTSLLRMLCGLLPPAAGMIAWRGKAIGATNEEYRAELAYLGHHNALKDELTPLENLRYALRLAGIAAADAELQAALEWAGLQERRNQACATLSQGQRRRVSLARIRLSATRRLWILDEPFTALDVAAVERTRDLVAAHLAGGGMAALTTHQEVPIPAPVTQRVELTA